jgi:hypothetical protein
MRQAPMAIGGHAEGAQRRTNASPTARPLPIAPISSGKQNKIRLQSLVHA